MILCLDIGNSHMHGGIFADEKLQLQFRMASKSGESSDQYGVFLHSVLRANGIDTTQIKAISLCSVVPEMLYPIHACCLKYFSIEPFILQAGVKTGLQIGYRNPLEVGADRIANAIAVTRLFPKQNAIIIDLGTATTFCAINRQKVYQGGVIIPGLKMSMKALERGASKLAAVEIVQTDTVLGKSTTESIQSGLYFGMLGAIKEIIAGLTEQNFNNQKPTIIATGGFTTIYQDSGIFQHIIPDLVLQGLLFAYHLNQ